MYELTAGGDSLDGLARVALNDPFVLGVANISRLLWNVGPLRKTVRTSRGGRTAHITFRCGSAGSTDITQAP